MRRSVGASVYMLEKQLQFGRKILVDAYKADGENVSDILVETEEMSAREQVEEQNKAQ